MNRQFGALSGLAILLIVLNHAVELALNAPGNAGYPPVSGWQHYFLTSVQALGVFAVPTFLFISGSFVAYAAQGEPPRFSRKFLISSLRHILLPYVVWSLVFYLFVYLLRGERYSTLGYVKNLLVGYPFHFVPLLAFYYVLSPLLVRIGRPLGGVLVLIAIGIYQLILINLLNPGLLGFTFPSTFDWLAVPVLRTTLADWAIYFPLGLYYGLNARRILPRVAKFGWAFAGLTALLFCLGLLDAFGEVRAPLARFLCPLTFVCILPGIRREKIPALRFLERVGRRTYGIYLTHLLLLNLLLFLLYWLLPWVFQFAILVSLIFLVAGGSLPLLLMEATARGPAKPVYRYLFG